MSWFERALDQQARERHVSPDVGPGLPRNPPGFRPEDIIGSSSSDGYRTIRDAARELAISETEVRELIAAGQLETQGDGPTLRVRPAIVTLLHVSRRGVR